MRHQGPPIGPAFKDELKAAGLLGLPFTWGDDGVVEFADTMTPATIAQVRAVADAHDAAKPAAPAPRGADFVATMFLAFEGKDEAAKLARGVRLLGKSAHAIGFVNLLDVPAPSATRLYVLRGVWAAIKADRALGLGGSDPDALTAKECTAIEAQGRAHGIDLAPEGPAR